MGERIKHRNIRGRLAFHVECTAFIHKFKEVANIWLKKFDPFLHYPSYKKQILPSISSVLEALRKHPTLITPIYFGYAPKFNLFGSKYVQI